MAKGTVYGYVESKAGLVADCLGREVADLRLTQALSGRRRGPVETELTEIVTDLYARLVRHRVSIKLVDRCAPELPDLGEVWFGRGRAGLVGWAVHLHWDPARDPDPTPAEVVRPRWPGCSPTDW